MAIHRDIWWLLGSAVAAIAAAPLIVQGDTEQSARRMAAARKIEQLSPAERSHLEENLKRFEKLQPADQARYREIHASIQQNPKVGEALDTFADWWPNVSGREQAELFKQRDPKQRMAIVSRVQDEIDEDRVRQAYSMRWGGRWRWERSLPREAFYEIMQALEGLATEGYLLGDELAAIQKHDPKSPHRYLALITALQKKQKTWSMLVPDAATEKRIIDAVSNEETRKGVRAGLQFGLGAGKGFLLRGQLVSSLAKEIYLDSIKQNVGGEADLLSKFDSLTDEARRELYSISAQESRHQLRLRVLKDLYAGFSPVPEFFSPLGGGFDPGRGRGGDDRRGDGGRSPDGRGEDRRTGDPPPRGDGPRGPDGPPPN